ALIHNALGAAVLERVDKALAGTQSRPEGEIPITVYHRPAGAGQRNRVPRAVEVVERRDVAGIHAAHQAKPIGVMRQQGSYPIELSDNIAETSGINQIPRGLAVVGHSDLAAEGIILVGPVITGRRYAHELVLEIVGIGCR